MYPLLLVVFNRGTDVSFMRLERYIRLYHGSLHDCEHNLSSAFFAAELRGDSSPERVDFLGEKQLSFGSLTA